MVTVKTCDAPNCDETFEAKTKAGRFCSARCRQRNARAPKTTGAAPANVTKLPSSGRRAVVTAVVDLAGVTRTALEKADRLDTPLGQNALLIAQRLDASARETGAAVAALERSFRAALADALANAEGEKDALDGLREGTLTLISGGQL